jgi:hypothetical protein
MSGDDASRESFEERVRSIAREVSRSIDRVAQVDVDGIAEAVGVDPLRATEWVDNAVGWMRARAEGLGDEVASWGAGLGGMAEHDPVRAAGPSPLDLPTEQQGTALAALDSGRWTVERGSHELVAHGEGPVPSDALGLVGELRARDWIGADGEVTLVGRRALSRWIDANNPR